MSCFLELKLLIIDAHCRLPEEDAATKEVKGTGLENPASDCGTSLRYRPFIVLFERLSSHPRGKPSIYILFGKLGLWCQSWIIVPEVSDGLSYGETLSLPVVPCISHRNTLHSSRRLTCCGHSCILVFLVKKQGGKKA